MAFDTSRSSDSPFLRAGDFVDSGHPAIVALAHSHLHAGESLRETAVRLYYAVRDGWRYDPYQLDFRVDQMRASAMLTRSRGHCVEKATLYAALCRAVGIPSRLRFANVRNHIGTARLEEFLGSNLLVFHGMAEVALDGRWVKATPAFNQELCAYLGVQPLEFDGREDSIFQEYDPQAGRFMVYEHDYGAFEDLPRDLMIASIKGHYGHLFDPERIAAFGMKVHL